MLQKRILLRPFACARSLVVRLRGSAVPLGTSVIIAACLMIPVSVLHAQGNNAASVTVSRVVVAEVNRGHRVIGSVRPLRTSTIGSAADGRVRQFFVNRGEPVTAGQPLAQLRTGTLEIELAAAEAEHELYKQQYLELSNGSREEDIAEARANLAGAEAARNNAANKLARAKSLLLSRAASDADLEDARANADLTRNTLAAAEALLARLLAGPRPEQLAQAAANVDLKAQQVRLIQDQIKKYTIVAPFDGFVAEEFTEVGAWVTRGDPVAKVIQLKRVELEVPATAEYALRLNRGDSVRVEFPELPERVFIGEIDRVVPMADPRARTYPILVRMNNEFENGSPLLLAGMLARVELPAGQPSRLPMIPKDALVLNGADRSVYVVKLDKPQGSLIGAIGNAKKVPVTLGVAFEDAIQVDGGLSEDDVVVVIGNERLVDGASVKIVGSKVVASPEPTEAIDAG